MASAIKEWYILIKDVKDGPFTPKELKEHPYVTLDTLVWKKSFLEWTPLRNVPELVKLFEKDEEEEIDEIGRLSPEDLGPFQLAIAIQGEPPHLIAWLIFTVLILLYVIYEFYFAR